MASDMKFDPKQFDQFEYSSLEKRAMLRLSENKDFDILAEVFTRWLVWRAHKLGSDPAGSDGNDPATLVALQGANAGFKKLLELVNGKDE